jgi:Domain of unknown function (DUF6894)
MAHALFRCSTAQGHVLDVANVDDLIEARDYATRLARSLVAAPTLRDWRTCCLSVSDDLGEELFAFPLSSIIGKPH